MRREQSQLPISSAVKAREEAKRKLHKLGVRTPVPKPQEKQLIA